MTTNLRRRLRKLEVLLTDEAGLVPHSPQWLAYWAAQLDVIVRLDGCGNGSKIPLEFVDALLASESTSSE
jgi:hypothetical protein